MAAYKVKISKANASARSKKAWETKRKNGTDKPWNKGTKGLQVAWNKGLTKNSDPRVKKNVIAMTATTRKQFKDGTRKPYIHTPEIDRKIAEGKLGEKNPMRIHPRLRLASRIRAVRTEAKKNRAPTDIERILYGALKSLNVLFEVGKNLHDTTVPDAFIKDLKIAIYADGEYHHDPAWRKEIDNRQTILLTALGYHVLRYRGKEIKAKDFQDKLRADLDEIRIKRALENRINLSLFTGTHAD